jgi:glutathione S-transferase
MLWRTGQRQVPVLQIDGVTIPDSSRIIAEVERRWPDPPLYPADPATRARALELEEYFDEEIGVHVRRAVFHLVLPDTGFSADFMTPGFSPTTKAIYRALFPMMRAIMRTDMGITDDGAARSLARFDAAFDRLEREIRPSGYLAGDAFSVADLTAAALLAPLTGAPGFPYAMPPLPPAAQAFRDRYAARPGFKWATEMYRRHRGTSAATRD